jgi:acetoin utilization protein AcuB
MKTISSFMSAAPHTINPRDSLSFAREQMNRFGVHHLPVVDADILLGLLSQRDLYLMESIKGVDLHEVPVEEAMTKDVLTVSADSSLAHVCMRMAQKHFGSAVVMDGRRLWESSPALMRSKPFNCCGASQSLMLAIENQMPCRGTEWLGSCVLMPVDFAHKSVSDLNFESDAH